MILEPAVERTPLVQNRSLMPSGAPSSRPAEPLARRASEALAISMACSGVSRTKALSARAASTASTWAWVSSTDENDFDARPSRAAFSVREVSALILFDHLRHDKEGPYPLRRVGQNRFRIAAL